MGSNRKRKSDINGTYKLIRLYRANDCLWNPKSSGFKNLALKERAWLRISQFFKNKLTVDQIKLQILSLRYYYATELLAIKRSKLGGYHYVPRQSFFADLEFLKEAMEHSVSVKAMESKTQVSSDQINCLVGDAFLLSSSENSIRSEKVDFQITSASNEDGITSSVLQSLVSQDKKQSLQLPLPPHDIRTNQLPNRVASGNDGWISTSNSYHDHEDDDYVGRQWKSPYQKDQCRNSNYSVSSGIDRRSYDQSPAAYRPEMGATPSTLDDDNNLYVDSNGAKACGPPRKKILTGRYRNKTRHSHGTDTYYDTDDWQRNNYFRNQKLHHRMSDGREKDYRCGRSSRDVGRNSNDVKNQNYKYSRNNSFNAPATFPFIQQLSAQPTYQGEGVCTCCPNASTTRPAPEPILSDLEPESEMYVPTSPPRKSCDDHSCPVRSSRVYEENDRDLICTDGTCYNMEDTRTDVPIASSRLESKRTSRVASAAGSRAVSNRPSFEQMRSPKRMICTNNRNRLSKSPKENMIMCPSGRQNDYDDDGLREGPENRNWQRSDDFRGSSERPTRRSREDERGQDYLELPDEDILGKQSRLQTPRSMSRSKPDQDYYPETDPIVSSRRQSQRGDDGYTSPDVSKSRSNRQSRDKGDRSRRESQAYYPETDPIMSPRKQSQRDDEGYTSPDVSKNRSNRQSLEKQERSRNDNPDYYPESNPVESSRRQSQRRDEGYTSPDVSKNRSNRQSRDKTERSRHNSQDYYSDAVPMEPPQRQSQRGDEGYTSPDGFQNRSNRQSRDKGERSGNDDQDYVNDPMEPPRRQSQRIDESRNNSNRQSREKSYRSKHNSQDYYPETDPVVSPRKQSNRQSRNKGEMSRRQSQSFYPETEPVEPSQRQSQRANEGYISRNSSKYRSNRQSVEKQERSRMDEQGYNRYEPYNLCKDSCNATCASGRSTRNSQRNNEYPANYETDRDDYGEGTTDDEYNREKDRLSLKDQNIQEDYEKPTDNPNRNMNCECPQENYGGRQSNSRDKEYVPDKYQTRGDDEYNRGKDPISKYQSEQDYNECPANYQNNTNFDGRDPDKGPICPKYQNIQDARGRREDTNDDCICPASQARQDGYQERQEYNRDKDQTYQENNRTDADFNKDKNNEPANQQEHYDSCICPANLPDQYNRRKQTFKCNVDCTCAANRSKEPYKDDLDCPCPANQIDPYKKEPYKDDLDCQCPANLKREPFKCNLDCTCPANRNKEPYKNDLGCPCPENQTAPSKEEPYKDELEGPYPANQVAPPKEETYNNELDCPCPENQIARYDGNTEPYKDQLDCACPENQPDPVNRDIEYPPENNEPETVPEKPLTDQEDLKIEEEVMLDCECATSEDDAEKLERAKEAPEPEAPIRAPCLCEAAVETDIDMTLTDRINRKKCNCSEDSLETEKLREKKANEEKNAISKETETSGPSAKAKPAKGAKKMGKICSCKPPVFNKSKTAKAASPATPVAKSEQLKQRSQSPVGAKPRLLSKRQNKFDDDGLNKFQALGGQARQYVYEMQDEIHINVSNHQNGGYEVYKKVNPKHVNKSQTREGLAILCSFRVPPTLAEKTMGILNNHISYNAPSTEDEFYPVPESQERPHKCYPVRNNFNERRNGRHPTERFASNPFLKLNFNASKRDVIVLHAPVPGFRPSKYSLSVKDFEVDNYERQHRVVERYPKARRPMPK
ncbi:uncharacterized protein LOC115770977 isoform X2 [Drosophila novamexicana]|uniref:uncharacterized protein LOC115770977 isoform X2 n=1 Tax=Drosophila novamexicana TaxID=47314 RepID=UPI0011E5D417|nr:uncharacterized protein LOC115770977 isoform X2 [Drosophila novamexicana]